MTMLMTKNIEDQERFESYVASFPSVFGRADQLLRFRAYLRGLLEPTDRKNVEGIAKAAAAEQGDTVITYCLVGYRASMTYFGARLLGYPVRLYDGSYQEWARRGLPLTR